MDFLDEYWYACDCTNFCHSTVDIESCLELNLKFNTMNKKKKAIALGALIENMKCKKNPLERKQSYGYTMGGRKVCKSFF